MATLKQRLHRKNSSGSYDTIHLETSASCVLLSSGTTVESKISSMDTAISGKAAASHNHAAGNITSGTLGTARGGTGITANPSMLVNLGSSAAASVFATSPRPGVTGTLPVTNGGTGVTSLDALKSALGISSGASSQYEIYPLGNLVIFDNKIWRCVQYDVSTKLLYLIAENIVSTTSFGSNNVYKGSTLASVAATYQTNSMSSTALAYCANVTVNGVTAKVFVPSYEQCNGGFSYFNGASTRIAYYNGSAQYWWTSSPNSDGISVCYVHTDGNFIKNGHPGSVIGFRPCVALQL